MVCSLVSITLDSPQLGKQLNKIYTNMLNFDFLEKGLEIVSLPHFSSFLKGFQMSKIVSDLRLHL